MITTSSKKNKKEVSTVEVVFNNHNPDLIIEKDKKRKIDVKIHFQDDIDEEMDNSLWRQLLEILSLDDTI